jgi:hypothetical protein
MSYHDHKKLENNDQKEALFNEYKGNLFEYLVADELARQLSLSSFFYQNLSVELLERLKIYQETLLSYDAELYKKLPLLAKNFVVDLLSALSVEEKKKLSGYSCLYVLGKLQANSGTRLWDEADLLFRHHVHSESEANSDELPISLKLSKKGSFTNTKSAGIKSFFLNYFKIFGLLPNHNLSVSLEERQSRFNQFMDNSFDQMTFQLYERNGLNYQGSFGAEWAENFTELPGLLAPPDHQILMDHYKRLSDYLLQELKELFEIDSLSFKECLLELMGFKSASSWQWTCYHQDHLYDHYSFYDLDFWRKKLMSSDLNFGEETSGFGTVNFHFDNFQVQLRIKPMNKFTSKAYKINCSMKWQKVKV